MREADRYGPNTPQVEWLIEQLRTLSRDQLENIATVELTTRRMSAKRPVLNELLRIGFGRADDKIEDVRAHVRLAIEDASSIVSGSTSSGMGDGLTPRSVDAFLGVAIRAVTQAVAVLVLRSLLTSVEFEQYWGALESEVHLLELEASRDQH